MTKKEIKTNEVIDLSEATSHCITTRTIKRENIPNPPGTYYTCWGVRDDCLLSWLQTDHFGLPAVLQGNVGLSPNATAAKAQGQFQNLNT